MKKRYLILAGLLVMTVAAAGCGKKKTTETAPVEVTATPTPEVTKAVDMVDMQQTADEDIKNVMGEKTSTASKIVFVNNTGDDIQSLYIRTHVDEDSEDYDNLIKKEIELNTTLDFVMKTHNLTKKREVVTLEDIKERISERTNVPITKLSTNDKDKLKNLNERIKKIVIGQDEAVDSVCKAIKRQRIGISNPNKPVVFLMAGSTGVGKSYLAKIIAKEIKNAI